eukprot:scaffold855_cov344-Prasinococcus_capsulatus_cf.AAC.5
MLRRARARSCGATSPSARSGSAAACAATCRRTTPSSWAAPTPCAATTRAPWARAAGARTERGACGPSAALTDARVAVQVRGGHGGAAEDAAAAAADHAGRRLRGLRHGHGGLALQSSFASSLARSLARWSRAAPHARRCSSSSC